MHKREERTLIPRQQPISLAAVFSNSCTDYWNTGLARLCTTPRWPHFLRWDPGLLLGSVAAEGRPREPSKPYLSKIVDHGALFWNQQALYFQKSCATAAHGQADALRFLTISLTQEMGPRRD